MKKKLLPFILGCAMVAAMPLAAHAADTSGTSHHYGNEIPTSGTSPHEGDESQNEFSEYNSDATAAQNQRVYTYGNPTVAGDNTVTWGAATLGNTRNTTATTQTDYPITLQNEQQGYRASDTPTTLANDIDDANTTFADATNDTAGTTDLETSVPEFTMQIPANTVLPIGATLWRIGNVDIEGKYFVRPDKVQLEVSKQNFHHTDYDTTKEESDSANTNKVIAFDVLDKSDGSSIVGTSNYTYFFQDGGTHMNPNFPHTYTEYTSANYEAGFVSDIKETHQVWIKPVSGAWTSKTAGKYTGQVTFTASVQTTDSEAMYTNKYPGEPALV